MTIDSDRITGDGFFRNGMVYDHVVAKATVRIVVLMNHGVGGI